MREEYPFVQAVKDRRGNRRYYFRKRNRTRVALPGKPGSPEFIAAYNEAMNPPKPPTVNPGAKGSLYSVIEEYKASADFSRLGPLTRREMGYVLAHFQKTNGEFPIAALRRKHILGWRDQLQTKPGAANKMLRTIRILMGFAIEREYRDDNPASKVKLLKVGEHRAWTPEELKQFEKAHPTGSLQRLGYCLALYTGQRRADVVAMTFKMIAGDTIRIVQAKTSASLSIPIHPLLTLELAKIHPRREKAILTHPNGEPMSPVYFGHMMAKAIEKAELPDDCVLHGLRKSAVVALIEAGCTPHEAAAITGHKSARMLEHYAKARDQERLGKAAMRKWAKK